MVFLQKHMVYIPKCNGNRGLPAEDQVKFDVRAMTGDEEERLVTLLYRTVEDGKEILVADAKVKETFLSQVDKVYGVWADAEKKKPVTTAAGFMALEDVYDYITETVAFIKSGCEEKELKNSGRPSTST